MTILDNRPAITTHLLWLDLTRKCPLECLHCYNDSGPDAEHGAMRRDDWLNVLSQAAECGVQKVTLIGGEPTMHPDFSELVDHAVNLGLHVEIYTNLVRVKLEWWELFRRPGVSLATSYYSDDPAEHNEITGRDSHRKTRANIARAMDLRIPLRAGVVAMRDGQRVHEASADLTALGVADIGTDRLRRIGRGAGEYTQCDPSELCGNCGRGRAAIGPNGDVSPCALSTWLTAGNVRKKPLAEILASEDMAAVMAVIPAAADPCDPGAECRPDAYPPPPPGYFANV